MDRIYRAAILEGSSFVGGELYRILSYHPNISVTFISSESESGELVERYNERFRYQRVQPMLRYLPLDKLDDHYDLIFSCLPQEKLSALLPDLGQHSTRILNLSGGDGFQSMDRNGIFTLSSPADLAASIRCQFFIPELTVPDLSVSMIQLPGGIAAASIYALYPLIRHHMISGDILIEAKVGSTFNEDISAAVYAERLNNFCLHDAFHHVQLPEIETLKQYTNEPLDIIFSAFDLDILRGVYITAYSTLNEGFTVKDVKRTYFSTYKDSPFIYYLINGQTPMLKTVCGTNNAEVSTVVKHNKCLSICSLDNLIKGAAGQAVQAANLYLGLDPSAGLDSLSHIPWP
ncbi:hypothetical protein [Vibrio mangrovi]|uniref:N-acetyl-gamma-glutamyl-phosphate reductase n=1 Tax=Vibrio mangrovi TaxID=474394 RepID=A0A1Y6IT33_9VIBR|nr:hypothetical protein [Vibrio mangrovi]MDW6003232.1 hypothetical protein [Vibrio mangrovi]SMR99980.1 N-acetyl-gamma-glutamyl-phosphate reductase [Vibrio mangrovi]